MRDCPRIRTPVGRSVNSDARVFDRSNVLFTLSIARMGFPSITSATIRLSISCLSLPGVNGRTFTP